MLSDNDLQDLASGVDSELLSQIIQGFLGLTDPEVNGGILYLTNLARFLDALNTPRKTGST